MPPSFLESGIPYACCLLLFIQIVFADARSFSVKRRGISFYVRVAGSHSGIIQCPGDLGQSGRLPANVRHLVIANQGLTSILNLAACLQAPAKVRSIDLSGNRLVKLESDLFGVGLSNVRKLHLNRCNLTHLGDGAFYTLPRLRVLDLAHNQLDALDNTWLYGLTHLRKLNVSSNQLVEVHDSWHSFSPAVRQLDLSGNLLAGTLSGAWLSMLLWLSLSSNPLLNCLDLRQQQLRLDYLDVSKCTGLAWQLESGWALVGLATRTDSNRMTLDISECGVRHLNSVLLRACSASEQLLRTTGNHIVTTALANISDFCQLQLDSSNLLCGCDRLPTLASLLNATLPKWRHKLFCANRNQSLADWMSDVSSCEHAPPDDDLSSSVELSPSGSDSPQLQHLVALHGEPFQLRCIVPIRAKQPGDVQVQWLLNGSALSAHSTLSQSVWAAETFESALQIPNPSHSIDQGFYACGVTVVETQQTVWPIFAQLQVLKRPRIVDASTNITAVVGTTAVLRCHADGEPPPEIRWKKVVGADQSAAFPAAQERRMHVLKDGERQLFYLAPVDWRDQGDYECLAVSQAGRASAVVHLLVLDDHSEVQLSSQLATSNPFAVEADQPLMGVNGNIAIIVICAVCFLLVILLLLCVLLLLKKRLANHRSAGKQPTNSSSWCYSDQLLSV